MRFPSARTLSAFTLLATAGVAATFAPPVGTTVDDFTVPGTQPGELNHVIEPASACGGCHAGYDVEAEPFYRWAGSMMAQSMRDPVFHACLAVANQDVAESGDLCIRCHSPGGWLEGRSTPTDGSALTGKDYDGVSCHVCHRLVDPIADPGNPPIDASILAGLSLPPTTSSSGSYVVDPEDRRRGPFDLGPGFPHHAWEHSSFHQESLLCASCHDVSNPALSRVGGPIPAASDSYVLNTLGVEHPTHDPQDQFPVERTFSEWALSDFASGPIDLGGRFGGNKTEVSSCQDCHMPDATGTGCQPVLGSPLREDVPQHGFDGANTWVPLAVYDLDQSLALYGASEASGYPLEAFQHAVDRNIAMLQAASDTLLTQEGDAVRVRVVNETGHKLPTGYPEGRRMWVNVRFLDAVGGLVAERGAYDLVSATLTTGDTVVYECQLGLDASMAAQTGLPAGESFHFALNNTIVKDNRIPPRGFDNAAFEAAQAGVIGASYADGQYWDENDFELPCGTASVEVTLYYQSTSKEYIEFLRDENVTNTAGQVAYDAWVAQGKSAPVDMDHVVLDVTPYIATDVEEISVSAGGAQTLCLNAGPAHAGKLYAVLGSLSGTSPGFPLGTLPIPLNLDAYTLFTLTNANAPPLVGSVGVLNAAGTGTMTFAIPAASNPNYAGTTLHHAFVTVTGSMADAVSQPAVLTLVP